MKIAIISDLHDNEAYLSRFLGWAEKNKLRGLLACGDLCNQETFSRLQAGFSGKIWIAPGNGDTFRQGQTEAERIQTLPREGGLIRIEEMNIGLCHEPKYIKKLLLSQPDFIFYGHTHRPDLQKEELTIIANPGTLGGWQYPSSFAVLDSETLQLRLVISEEEKI